MNRRLGVAVVLGVIVVSQLAAGLARGADAPEEPPAPISACELFDPGEVATAVGTSIEGAEDMTGVLEDQDGWISICHYWRDPTLFLAVVAVALASGPGYRETFEDMRVAPDTTPVDGIGDDALLQMPSVWGLDQPVGSLHVRVGDTVLGISLGISDMTSDGRLIQLGDREAQTAMLMELATTGVGRIGADAPTPVDVPPICDLLSLADAGETIGAPLVTSEVVVENDDWGPGCHYRDADGDVLLFLGLSAGPEALSRFDACAAYGVPVSGVGEAAFVGAGAAECDSVFVGSYFIDGPLVVRSGETVLIVAAVTEDPGSVNRTGSREEQITIARRVLEQLGLDPGATPAPIDTGAVEHPCSLLTQEEVATLVGVPITSSVEVHSDGYPALCQFLAQGGNALPLTLGISTGESAMEEWASYAGYRKGDKVPVDGLGDEALSEIVEGGCCDLDGPLVSVWVRVGETLLRLDMGPVERNLDYTMRVAGTPDEQLTMLRALAEIALPRLSE